MTMLPQNIVIPPRHSEAILSMSAWPSSIATDMEHLMTSVDLLANSDTMTPYPAHPIKAPAASSLPSDKRKKKWRKPKDKPKRPLSAYNLFFQLERQRLLDETSDGGVVARTLTSPKGPKSKLGFASLARHIATKWKTLDDDAMTFYQELADKEQVRYMKDLVQWKIHEAQEKYDTDETSVSSREQQQALPAAPSQENDLEAPSPLLDVSHHEPHQVSSSSWVKMESSASHEASTTTNSVQTCVRDHLFGGFDDGTANLSMIIQELAREQQQQGRPSAAPPQQQEMEPLPFSIPTISTDFGGGTTSNWLEGYQKIAANMFMPPPLSRSLTAFYEDAGITSNNNNNSAAAPSSSPSLRQLTMDLSDEEQDFLISSLTS